VSAKSRSDRPRRQTFASDTFLPALYKPLFLRFKPAKTYNKGNKPISQIDLSAWQQDNVLSS
jgi:hypothetical protein